MPVAYSDLSHRNGKVLELLPHALDAPPASASINAAAFSDLGLILHGNGSGWL